MTNEGLEQSLNGLRDLINQRFEENEKAHSAVLTQAIKTNGRVRSLEKWKYTISGALIIISIILSVISFKIIIPIEISGIGIMNDIKQVCLNK